MNFQGRSERNLDVFASRLAASYEHVGTGIIQIDRDGRILRANQHSCKLTGFSAAELLGRTIFEEAHPEDAELDLVQFKRQLAGEIDSYTIEKRLIRKDGSYVWAEVTSSSVRDAAGNFLHAIRVQHDIAARKQAEHELGRRMDEQAALFQFAECLQHVNSVEEIHEVALEAIMRALDCERASILLFDDSNVMRLVAWRGLSPDYRKAVEERSPWSKAEKSRKPVLVEQVSRSNLPIDLKEVVVREGVRAIAVIPILLDGKLVGKFIAYYDRPLSLSEPQIDVALTLAQHFGLGLARFKAEEGRRAAERSTVQRAETQQRLLLDELNHRTKNNMQMLLSLLSTAARRTGSEEARHVLDEACGRIAAMAAAQRVLYGRADADRFDAGEFLKAVCQTIQQVLPPHIQIVCEPSAGELANDAAMPLALIVNELVTNAVKYGFKGGVHGGVRISLTESDGQRSLSVEDPGEGFDLNTVPGSSSGLQLVSGLARQLQGSFVVTRNPSKACLRFPASRSA